MKAAAYVGVLSIAVLLLLSAGAPAYASAGQTRTPIKHLINIYLENHTFDNFFGVYPIDPSSPNQSLVASLSAPTNILDANSTANMPSPIPPGTFSTPDPVEGNTAYHIDWNGGKMNGFVDGSGPSSMTYYTASQLGPLWDLAEEYSLANMYFAPLLSESAPNTMYYLAGYSPVMNDYGPPPSIPFSQTIMGELQSYGVSWGFFIPYQSQGATYSEWSHVSGMNDRLGNVFSWRTFVSDLNSGDVPSVSWVFSQGANGTDQGAPSNVLKGEMWIIYLINEIERSPIWNSTAITITWDDPGGYYDQVPPPVIDGVQSGFRLPMILVSPFAKEDYVSNTVLTHSSILALIDYNWEVPALNQYVSSANVPLDFFDFSAPYGGGGVPRAPMTFDFGSNFPLPQSPYFDLPGNLQSQQISSTFPMQPQYSLSSLPYPRHGSTNTTLSSLGSGVFVQADSAVVPFYASVYFLTLLVAANVVLLAWGVRVRRRGRG
ncbi:MAG: alkaline phosphatase family protein [Nitrososphaerota archaeon]|jgi:phospholipase C|nr:alkaline phosphatase family protein [Nitrososphaerota archaeon]MDG6937448.1 alkaline phosphatase family protein [Nitrososphaerota archaeon]MDG6962065.1 alkaline phosphatase family protein [Nitrososphaerota archaeon]MDG6962892.1 alkaline phosphatase family protein [Nitrososphaerota archaeon]MDG6971351.1 alkaline phosphatase family protein [Nitrososphaerota archaeon]